MGRILTSILVLILSASTLLYTSEARVVHIKNSCSFAIDVEATPGGVICNNVGAGGSCSWNIPAGGWSGNIHRRNREGTNLGFPSATLAEFAFGNSLTGGQWNWDWFDISIIPPGCPGTITSYDGCWCNGGSDGYDVGMRITPAKCTDKQRTCLDRNCAGAYGYPKDDSKTTVCQDISGDFNLEFCPAGSRSDLGSTALSQTPPCRGGGSPPPPPPANKPNPPPPPPASHSATCVVDNNIDYYGNDITNKPVASKNDCCNFCASVSGCNAWTYAGGVCYAKKTAGSDRRSASGLQSGTILSRAVAADSQTLTSTDSSTAQSSNSIAIIAVIVVVAVIIALFFIIAFVVNMKAISSKSERV